MVSSLNLAKPAHCSVLLVFFFLQEVEAQDDTHAVSGDICTVTSGVRTCTSVLSKKKVKKALQFFYLENWHGRHPPFSWPCRGSLTLNMFFSSLKYTSPTFVASMVNAVASITFIIAIILGMEIVHVRSLRGLSKIAGAMVSFAGVTTISLYKGAAVKSLWKAPIQIHGSSGVAVAHESWVKGSLLAVASCICWSLCFILQVPLPAPTTTSKN